MFPFSVIEDTYSYYKKVLRKMRTAIVSYLLKSDYTYNRCNSCQVVVQEWIHDVTIHFLLSGNSDYSLIKTQSKTTKKSKTHTKLKVNSRFNCTVSLLNCLRTKNKCSINMKPTSSQIYFNTSISLIKLNMTREQCSLRER